MYTQLPVKNIDIDIPDLIIGDTTIKRSATLFDMKYNPSKKFVAVQWVVKHFANVNGKKGEAIDVIPDYTKETIADNDTMCDVSTGVPIEKNEFNEYDDSITYTGQYDFFA